MRGPIHAGHLLGVEADLFMERAAQRVQHPTFDRAAQRFRIDDEAAVVRADEPLHTDMAGAAVDLDLSDLRHNGLIAEGVGDATAAQNISATAAFRRRTSVPTV